MPKIKCGVIGLGMGAAHVGSFRTHPEAEVTAVADTDPVRLKEKGGKELQVPNLYESAEEMFERAGLDVVAIAVPNKLHKPLTIAALESGIDVICEKPMAMNTTEAVEMKKASERTGKRLMINFSYRFKEQSYAIKKEIEEGILGDIYFARTQWLRRRGLPGFGGWFGQKELSGGGPLIDLGVHRIDLALWLMRYPAPVWVMGNTYSHIADEKAKAEGQKFNVEDMATGFVKFDNGASMAIEASWASNIREKEFMSTQLLGTRGGMKQYNVNEAYEFNAEFNIERNGVQYDMKVHPPVPEAHNSMYHFVDSIINNTPHTATADEGITVMKLLDALYESAAKNEPVRIKK
jgi:predicted dehydrogenase